MFQKAEINTEMVIYIILMVIYVLYYLLKKKAPESKPRPDYDADTENDDNDFEEIRRKVLGLPKEIKQDVMPVETPQFEQMVVKRDVYDKMKIEKMVKSHTRKPRKEALKVIDLEEDEAITQIYGVDATSAIVVSEILKRPEH